jgi:ribonuclease Z
MLSTLNIKLVNGLGGDPAVYVQPIQSSDCILFDAGSLETLSNKELLRIRVVAISHTHLDHFVGFDRLIRVNVPHFRTLEIIGPSGITAHVQSKLKAYTWNLLDNGQLNFVVHEIDPLGQATAMKLTNDNHFEPIPLNLYSTAAVVSEGAAETSVHLTTVGGLSIKAVCVDHGIPVLAFCLEMPSSHVVSKNAFNQLKLTPGPWISQLQKLAVLGDLNGQIDINGSKWDAQDLANKILMPRPGDKLMYVTDMIFRADNLARLVNLAGGGVDLLICESNYIHRDRDKAQKKFHLTSYQAALLAAAINAKALQVFHISNIYSDNFSIAEEEAAQSLAALKLCDPRELNSRLSKECTQLPQTTVSLAT